MEELIAGTVFRIGHTKHRLAYQVPVRGFRVGNLCLISWLAIRNHRLAGLLIFQQVRRDDPAIIEQRHQRFDHLNRCGNPVALANTYGDGIALIPGFFVYPLFPVAAWQQAAVLFDTAGLTVTKLAQHGMNTVNAHHIGYLIEEGIG